MGNKEFKQFVDNQKSADQVNLNFKDHRDFFEKMHRLREICIESLFLDYNDRNKYKEMIRNIKGLIAWTSSYIKQAKYNVRVEFRKSVYYENVLKIMPKNEFYTLIDLPIDEYRKLIKFDKMLNIDNVIYFNEILKISEILYSKDKELAYNLIEMSFFFLNNCFENSELLPQTITNELDFDNRELWKDEKHKAKQEMQRGFFCIIEAQDNT